MKLIIFLKVIVNWIKMYFKNKKSWKYEINKILKRICEFLPKLFGLFQTRLDVV